MNKKVICILLVICLMLTAFCAFVACDKLENPDDLDVPGPNENPGTQDDDESVDQGNTDLGDDTPIDENPPQTTEFEYTVENGAVTIIGYKGSSSHVMIPETIDGLPVKKISAGAFVTQQSPQTKARRSANAAGENNNEDDDLEQNQTIYIPESIDEIEEGAFETNKNFYVTNAPKKPDGWKDSSITGSAQNENDKDGNVYFEAKKDDCVIKDDLFFVYNYHTLGYFVADCFNESKEIKIPNNINGLPVNNIGTRAFQNCVNLEKITFSKDITYVWQYAFMNCVSLREVIFNSPNIIKLATGAFSGCTSIEKIQLPENLINIQAYAFENCGIIKEITMPSTLVAIQNDAFLNTSIEKIVYNGSNDKFDRIQKNNNEQVLANAQITFSEDEIIEGITKLNDLKNVDAGTAVTVRGYVATYIEFGDGFLLIDDKNEYGVVIYIQNNDPITNLPAEGDYVEVNGSVTNYGGLLEITYINRIDKISSKTLTPQKVTAHELNTNSGKYLYKYIEIELTVTQRESYYTYFEEIDMYFFSRAGGNPLKVGDEIIFRGTVTPHSTLHELQGVYENIEVLNRDINAPDAPSDADICLTVDLLGIPNGSTSTHTGLEINGVTYQFTRIGNGGFGMQFGPVNSESSSIGNKTAFERAIEKIVITMHPGKTTYDNKDAICVTFGNSFEELGNPIVISTVGATYEYTITPDSNTYTYFYLEKILQSYTFNIKSIEIYFVNTEGAGN